MVGPDGGKGSKSSWGFNVSDQTDNFQWWGFNDGNSFNFLLVVEFRFDSVDFSEDVGHTGLESSEGSEVWCLGSVISGE